MIFDADDTLWENNIYFERAIDDFIRFLDHSTLEPDEVRTVLGEIERANCTVHGYGAVVFGRSLAETFARLAERRVQEADLQRIRTLAERILTHELELLPDVPETIDALAWHHDLMMLTKGDLEHQRLKVERSGLVEHFQRVEILSEKDAATYRRLAESHGWNPATTWMIGNSPRSDINPALAAGLNAVFIPHPQTWHLEHEEIARAPEAPGQLLTLARFADLRGAFLPAHVE